MKRGGFKFKTALARRDRAYRAYLVAQKAADKAKKLTQDWDDRCNSVRRIYDTGWEPKFPRIINFSGYED